jgi:chromatin segregation and condensation protein Rec8/ScpA/Scc1 (kleisin family)
MQSVIANLPKKEILPKVMVKKVISIEEMINNITERMSVEIKTSFSRLSGHTGTAMDREKKVNIIVGFLAMLELVKQGIILVSQEKHFEDIGIENNKQVISGN